MTLTVNLQPLIHKLPSEILCQIFVVHGSRNKLSRHREIPGFKITAVCSYWRTVALATIELWNSISLVVTHQWDDSKDYLLQRLLDLSAQSALFVSIDIMGPSTQIPPVLHRLFNQSRRWQTLSVVCIPSPFLELISQLPLDSLLAFDLTTLQSLIGLHPLKAPKLHRLILHLIDLIDLNTSFIPWPQITSLTVRKGYIPLILEVLPRMPNLSKLNFRLGVSREIISDRSQPAVKSNLTSLAVSFRIQQTVHPFFDAVLLPNLTSLTLISERDVVCDATSAASDSIAEWSQTTLPSLLTRSGSSAILTSFTLQEIQIRPIDLTSLLHLMPNLRNLSLSEPFSGPDSKPRMANHFLSTLALHSDVSSSESGLVPNLTSLSLDLRRPFDSDSNLMMLLDLITSRPNLRTVYLKIHNEDLNPSDFLVASFADLRKDGMDVRIKDAHGDVLFGERRGSGKCLLE